MWKLKKNTNHKTQNTDNTVKVPFANYNNIIKVLLSVFFRKLDKVSEQSLVCRVKKTI